MVSTHITDKPLEEAGRIFSQWLSDCANKPILILVSGGSAFSILSHIPTETFGPHITLGVLDERWSRDPAVNNFAQLSASDFFKRAHERGAAMIDTMPGEGETKEALADRFEQSLRVWRSQHPDGAVLITQGMGPDGHTAGILPFSENAAVFKQLFEDTSRWVVSYRAPDGSNPHLDRVTVTVPFLVDQVRNSLMYATGAEKQAVLERFSAEKLELHQFPAMVLYKMQHVTLVTDIGK